MHAHTHMHAHTLPSLLSFSSSHLLQVIIAERVYVMHEYVLLWARVWAVVCNDVVVCRHI